MTTAIALTADEVLEQCREAMGKPLNRMQQLIGFPREGSLGGPVMRKVADAAGKFSPLGLRRGPYFILSMAQITELSKELGREIINSGDVLFGIISVGAFEDSWSDATEQRELLRDYGAVDLRGDAPVLL